MLSSSQQKIEERNWTDASEIAKKILQIDPENQIGFGALIRSMIGLNKFNEVKETIDALAVEIRNSKPVLDALSTLDASEKAFKARENIQALKEHLKKDPENLDYLLDMAIALFGNNEIEASFEMLLKSIKLNREWKDQAARKQLLEFFKSAGFEAEETINARRKLATLLFS